MTLQYYILQIVHGGKLLHLCGSFDNYETFTVKQFLSIRVIKWRYTVIKACEKDTCEMPLPSQSGLLKKQLDSAVLEEANKEVSKLITSAGGKQNYTSSESYHCKACSRTFIANSSSVISALARLWCRSLFAHVHMHA